MIQAQFAEDFNFKIIGVCIRTYVIAGEQSLAGATNCTKCPSGYACPSRSDPSQNAVCSPGSYSEEGVDSCTSCPPTKMCPDTQWVHSISIPLHALLPRCALTLSEFIVHPSLYMPSFQDVLWQSVSSSYIHPSTCPPSKMCPDTQWVHSISIPLHALLPRCALTVSEFILHPSLYVPSFQDVPWHSVSS